MLDSEAAQHQVEWSFVETTPAELVDDDVLGLRRDPVDDLHGVRIGPVVDGLTGFVQDFLVRQPNRIHPADVPGNPDAQFAAGGDQRSRGGDGRIQVFDSVFALLLHVDEHKGGPREVHGSP
jgi:hypothetical protein